MIIEAHGRFGPAGLASLRRAYRNEPEMLQDLLREISALGQSHTAAMIMAAHNNSTGGQRTLQAGA
eukprot:4266435-Karenia_brevis.AAC.1